MSNPEITNPDYPVLVIAYDDKSREILSANIKPFGVATVPCALFCEAENHALSGCCKGILVDLATMIKSKSEEKIVAYTLTNIYPTLRVKTLDSMLIPMAMAGDAKQDKSLSDFFTKTCAGFTPRRLRSNKRKDICVPVFIGAERAFTLNFSWSGVFIADMNPERFSIGKILTLTFPDFGLDIEVIVARLQNWGHHRPPGIGVQFKSVENNLESHLFALLKSDKTKDRDRQVN
jgi:hypothetical protein